MLIIVILTLAGPQCLLHWIEISPEDATYLSHTKAPSPVLQLLIRSRTSATSCWKGLFNHALVIQQRDRLPPGVTIPVHIMCLVKDLPIHRQRSARLWTIEFVNQLHRNSQYRHACNICTFCRAIQRNHGTVTASVEIARLLRAEYRLACSGFATVFFTRCPGTETTGMYSARTVL